MKSTRGSGAAVLRLPAEPASVPLARRHVAAVLEQHDLSGVSDTALLVVSELVTNAVRHASTDVRLTVLPSRDRVRVEVEDGSARLPVTRSAGPLDPGGRGLPLVAELADEWGTAATPSGKLVWAELRTGSGPGTSSPE